MTIRPSAAGLRFDDVMSLDAVVSVLRAAAFALPSGLGVTDAGYVVLLGAYGVPDPTAAVRRVRAPQAREGGLLVPRRDRDPRVARRRARGADAAPSPSPP